MLLFIPLLSFVFIFLWFYEREGLFKGCWRSSFLAATACWGTLLVLGTEILSLFRLLTFTGILIYWILMAVITGTMVVRFLREFSRKLGQGFRFDYFKEFSQPEKWMLGGIGMIMLVTAVIAYFYPPNNWDSLTYHMARVVHWAQNHSLAPYPTSVTRQLIYPPASSYFFLHLYVLGLGDFLLILFNGPA